MSGKNIRECNNGCDGCVSVKFNKPKEAINYKRQWVNIIFASLLIASIADSWYLRLKYNRLQEILVINFYNKKHSAQQVDITDAGIELQNSKKWVNTAITARGYNLEYQHLNEAVLNDIKNTQQKVWDKISKMQENK